MKKPALVAAILAGVLTLLLVGVYAVVFGLIPSLAEASFRENFGPVLPWYAVRPDSQRAADFGGSCGLKRLYRLRADLSISPIGRKTADRLIHYIESGQHVVDLRADIKEIRSNGWDVPPYYRYAEFVIWHDQAMVKK